MEYEYMQKNAKSCSNESEYHKKTKYMLAKVLLSQPTHRITKIILEKPIGDRRADIWIELSSKDQIAIEIQNSIMSVKELQQRTNHYTQNGVYVLWILNGKGPVVAEGKVPKTTQDVKLSTLERALHFIYGGRVYYVNKNGDQITLFGLHYTCSLKRKYRAKRFRTRYSFYYVMDQDPIEIPNYMLLCTDFNNVKIARFFDTNLVKDLMFQIKILIGGCGSLSNKRLLKYICKNIRPYNFSLIYHAVLKLIEKCEIDIKKRHIPRAFRNYYSKYRF